MSLGADKVLNDLAADDEMGDWRISTNRIQTAVEHVAGPRRYVETYWGASALRSKLTDAGWIVSEVCRCIGKPDDRWLSVRASRA